MATLGKRKNAVQKPWRPDFKNAESLPDTKVVRTGFLLNSLGIIVALVCIAIYASKESDLQGLASSVKELERQVESATPNDRQLLDINKNFLLSAATVSEVIAFDTEPVKFHDFLSQIGNAVPEATLLTEISISQGKGIAASNDASPLSIKLTGKVFEGSKSTPAQVLELLQNQILLLKCLQGKSPAIEMGLFSRNSELGHFDFTLSVTIPAEKTPVL